MCVFLQHKTDRWLLAVLAEYSYCVQWHVHHLNTALCDMVWGYNRAGCSSVAIFIQTGSRWSDLSHFILISLLNHKVLQSQTPSSSLTAWNEMISDRSISEISEIIFKHNLLIWRKSLQFIEYRGGGRYFIVWRPEGGFQAWSWCFNSHTSPVSTAVGVRIGCNEKHQQLSICTPPD